MGNKGSKPQTTTNVENFVSSLSSQVFKTMVTIKNECKQTGTVMQDMSLNVGNDEVVAACMDTSTAFLQHLARDVSAEDMVKLLDAQKGIVKECQGMMTQNTIMRDIENTADMDISSSCKFEQADVDKMNSQLTNNLMAKAAESKDDFGESLKNVTSVFSGGQGGKVGNVLNSTDVKSFVDKTFSVDSVNEMIAEYHLIQSLNMNVTSAKDTYIAAVKQTARVKALMSCLTKNSTVADALANIGNTSTSDASQKGQGLVDLGDSLFTNANQLGSNLGDSAFGAMGAVAYAWIAGVFALLIIIVIVIYLVVRSRRRSNTSNYYPPPSEPYVPPSPNGSFAPPPPESPYAGPGKVVSALENEAARALRSRETQELIREATRIGTRALRRR